MNRIGIPILLFLLLVGCSTPHVLPEAPTPIPRLAPATLPVAEPEEPTPVEASEKVVDEADASAPETGDFAAGADLYQAIGCGACHSLDGTAGVGPSMSGLYGSERSLDDGSSVTADDAYLRMAIVEPGAQLVSGFGNLMPAAFGDTLSEDEIVNLIAYIRELGNE